MLMMRAAVMLPLRYAAAAAAALCCLCRGAAVATTLMMLCASRYGFYATPFFDCRALLRYYSAPDYAMFADAADTRHADVAEAATRCCR